MRRMPTAAVLALALCAFALEPLRSLPADVAILSEGTLALRGLPFFAPNAIRALGGEYSLGPTRIQVWFTRDAVAFSEVWKRTPFAGYVAYVQTRKDTAAGKGALFALALGPYELFIQVPEDSSASRSFISAFERRFAVFYANAKDDSELSFPAFVDLRAAK
jgi:hypothetical protein